MRPIAHSVGLLRRRAGIALLAALACTLVAAPSASAGRLVVTGHDADHHCGRDGLGSQNGQCHYVRVATSFVREGAPDPSKPVLVIDRGALDMARAVDKAFPVNVPRRIVDPRSPEFATLPITTNDYSAILIASSYATGPSEQEHDLNEESSTPDSDAINRRAADIQAFYNAGGGIYANSGGNAGDGEAAVDTYYRFLPLPVGGRTVAGPFRLTEVGRAVGFTDGSGGTPNDINCCVTHNSFARPAPDSALRTAETDGRQQGETLISESQIQGDKFVAPPITTRPERIVTLPKRTRCYRSRFLPIKLNRPKKSEFTRMTVFVNRKRVAIIRGGRLNRTLRLRIVRFGLFRVRVVVENISGQKVTLRRTYRVCRPIAKRRVPQGEVRVPRR